MQKGKPYKYKVNILYENGTSSLLYCNDVKGEGDYLVLVYDDVAKDYEIFNLRNVVRFRIREEDE